MKKKKGFTLLELMVTLLILSILSLMISAILIQSQKILIRTDKSSQMQNEVRTALFKIQRESEDYNLVTVSNKYGFINNNKWEIIEGSTSSREILRFSNEDNDIAKIYVEVYENNIHKLIEFNINKTTNEIIADSTNILISNIDGTDVDKIKTYTENIYNSNNEIISELITINCSSIVKGNIKDETEYIISFSKNSAINIDVIDGSSSSGNSNNNTGNGNSSGNNSPNTPSLDESTVAEWDVNKEYHKGDIVKYNGVVYIAYYDWTKGNNPEHGNVWTILSKEPTIWKVTKVYLENQKVIHNGRIYVAKYYANAGMEPGKSDCWALVN